MGRLSRTSSALRRLVDSAKAASRNRRALAAAASRTARVKSETSVKVNGPCDAAPSNDESQTTVKRSRPAGQGGHDDAAACPGIQPCSVPLPTDLQLSILQLLPAQEPACTARLVCKAAAAHFSGPAHRTVQLGLPMSLSVAQQWRAGAEGALKQLSFQRKLLALSTAASSGCEANLEAAWALIGPGVSPELLPPQSKHLTLTYSEREEDPGTAAASAGHLHLLPWLLRHRLPLRPERTLVAAAPHGDLAALQDALLLLHSHMNQSPYFLVTHEELMCRVAAGGGPHATSKLDWLLPPDTDERGELDLDEVLWLVAESAFQAPDPVPVLMWVQGHGVDLRELPLVMYAIGSCGVGTLDWLVGEVGCRLPGARPGEESDEEEGWEEYEEEEFSADAAADAAAAGGRVGNLQWLQQHGVVLGDVGDPEGLLVEAAEGGHLGAVRYLHEECGIAVQGDPGDRRLVSGAVNSGNVELVAWLRANGVPLGPEAIQLACGRGDLAMLRWLLQEANCPTKGLTVERMVGSWAVRGGKDGSSGGSQLLEAVQLLLHAGCRMGAGEEALASAAIRGDLATCRYLLEDKRVRLGPWVPFFAARGGCEAVLEYFAAAAGCKGWCRKGRDPYLAAGRAGDLATLRCLRRLGAPLRKGLLNEAAAECPLSVLQLLVEWGGAPGRAEVGRVLAAAREKGAVREVVAWLRALHAGSRGGGGGGGRGGGRGRGKGRKGGGRGG